MTEICVIGAGRMGSIYGGLLAKHGLDVVLYDNWEEHIRAIQSTGLKLSGLSDVDIRIEATTDAGRIKPRDLAIILTDTNTTPHAAEVAARVLKPDGFALTLQNGIGNIEILSEALGTGRVLAGLSYHSGAMAGPGHAVHTHRGPTYVGELDGTKSSRLERLVKILELANLNPVVVDDVSGQIWEKWIHNCAINPVSAASGLRVGEISSVKAADELQSRIIEEAIAITKAKGIALPEADPMRAIKSFCRVKFNKPSMLQHMEEGRTTEIDALNGAAVKLGRELGIPTPYNDALTLMIKAREAYMRIASNPNPIDYEAMERRAKEESLRGAAA
jgi:2-dehydropantoate 2-reductase